LAGFVRFPIKMRHDRRVSADGGRILIDPQGAPKAFPPEIVRAARKIGVAR
jgi:hypothetical protein